LWFGIDIWFDICPSLATAVLKKVITAHLVWVNEWLDSHFDVVALEEAAELRQNGNNEDGDNDAHEDGHGAQLARRQGVTDVDVALDSQRHRQPDRRRMERRRDVLRQAVVGETPRVRDPVTVTAERVEVDEARYRPDTCHRRIKTDLTAAEPTRLLKLSVQKLPTLSRTFGNGYRRCVCLSVYNTPILTRN